MRVTETVIATVFVLIRCWKIYFCSFEKKLGTSLVLKWLYEIVQTIKVITNYIQRFKLLHKTINLGPMILDVDHRLSIDWFWQPIKPILIPVAHSLFCTVFWLSHQKIRRQTWKYTRKFLKPYSHTSAFLKDINCVISLFFVNIFILQWII